MRRKYKRGMVLKSVDTGRVVTIVQKATGNRHWTVKTDTGNTHHVHEGTLDKHYETVAAKG